MDREGEREGGRERDMKVAFSASQRADVVSRGGAPTGINSVILPVPFRSPVETSCKKKKKACVLLLIFYFIEFAGCSFIIHTHIYFNALNLWVKCSLVLWNSVKSAEPALKDDAITIHC